MVRVSVLTIAASALFIASPAAAQSWWVVGQTDGGQAVFVDSDSIAPDGGVRVLTISANGAAEEELRSVRCADTAEDAVAAFVCADDATRMRTAAMLGSLTPELAARAIFSVAG